MIEIIEADVTMEYCRMWLLVIGAVVASPPSAVAGTCALCRQALASGGNPGLIQGLYWSILLIAGVPLVMMVTVGWIALRQRRLARRMGRMPGVPSSMSRTVDGGAWPFDDVTVDDPTTCQ